MNSKSQCKNISSPKTKFNGFWSLIKGLADYLVIKNHARNDDSYLPFRPPLPLFGLTGDGAT